MLKKTVITVILIIALITTCLPSGGYVANAGGTTVPDPVTREVALSRLQTLKEAFADKGYYFTITGKTCQSPAKKEHPTPTHKDCNLGHVIASAWIKKVIDLVPDSSVQFSQFDHYRGDIAGGWSCAAFAEFASWYVYAQKSTDQVSYGKKAFYYGEDTKAALSKAVPGDIIRTSSGHSMVFIRNLPNGKQYEVIDCNYTTVGSNEGNCKIKVHKMDYNNKKFKITISRATNYCDTFSLYTNLNYSGKNYLYYSDSTSLDPAYWSSRDENVATISADSSTQHNGYNSIKIVNSSKGSSDGKDLGIRTMTQGTKASCFVGDKKSMTLSFWAKASSPGARMYFRWGYEDASRSRSIELTDSWKQYEIRMDKTASFNNYIQTYVNKAGTVWITEMQLEDGTAATRFSPETGGSYQTVTSAYGGNYTLPDVPVRKGFVFDGWYTAPSGGSKISSSTAVINGHIMVYAHWSEYSGTPTNLSGANVSFSDLEKHDGQYWMSYDGSNRPRVTVKIGSKTLDNDTDFNVKYTSNDKVGTATATITGVGRYKGSASAEYYILFKDVPYNSPYREDICWAYDRGIASGYGYTGTGAGQFGLKDYVTRGQFVAFLWNYAGKPEPAGNTQPFKDVPVTHNFYKAIQWGYEQGIVSGYGDGTFRPSNNCTRGVVMVFLYRAAGEPEVSGNTQPFKDVPVTHNFYKAIQWGYESGIAVAYADGRFGVADSCKRAHAVYFLHKMDSWLNLSPVGKVGNSVIDAAEALRDAATGSQSIP